jgi:mannosyltransferase OCH1-like enzyme
MKIPKIIHQTWKNEDTPVEFRKMAYSWVEKHTDWSYVFWTDEMNRQFIKENFPFFLKIYDAYISNIQRVDAVRYFVLFKYGGMFIDLDFECLQNITSIIKDAECVFGKEPDEHCLIHNKSIIVSNAFMATVPGHDFFDVICSEIAHGNEHVTDHPNDRILETTGPFLLSRLYMNYERKENVKILDASCIYPLSKEELVKYQNDNTGHRELAEKLKKAYAVHHYAGTWWKTNSLVG